VDARRALEDSRLAGSRGETWAGERLKLSTADSLPGEQQSP
jgi:hypothetical protein